MSEAIVNFRLYDFCQIDDLQGACNHLIVGNDIDEYQVYTYTNNTHKVPRNSFSCPWNIVHMYRPNYYPNNRHIAKCSKVPCREYSDIIDPLGPTCQPIYKLEPVLVRNKTINLWEFKLEKVSVSCGCRDRTWCLKPFFWLPIEFLLKSRMLVNI